MPTYPDANRLYGANTDTFANALATRQSDPALVGGPALTAGLPYLKGMADAVLSSLQTMAGPVLGVGFQLASQITLSSAATVTTTYADMPNALTTFTAPVAKTYGILAIVTAFSSIAGWSGWVRISVNNSSFSGEVISPSDVQRNMIMVIHSAPCVQGANTLRLQWRIDAAGQQFNVDGNCKAQFFVVG